MYMIVMPFLIRFSVHMMRWLLCMLSGVAFGMTPLERLDDLSVKMQRILRAAQEHSPVSDSVTAGMRFLVTRYIMHESRELDIFVDLLEFVTQQKVSYTQFANYIQVMKNELIPKKKKPEIKDTLIDSLKDYYSDTAISSPPAFTEGLEYLSIESFFRAERQEYEFLHQGLLFFQALNVPKENIAFIYGEAWKILMGTAPAIDRKAAFALYKKQKTHISRQPSVEEMKRMLDPFFVKHAASAIFIPSEREKILSDRCVEEGRTGSFSFAQRTLDYALFAGAPKESIVSVFSELYRIVELVLS